MIAVAFNQVNMVANHRNIALNKEMFTTRSFGRILHSPVLM